MPMGAYPRCGPAGPVVRRLSVVLLLGWVAWPGRHAEAQFTERPALTLPALLSIVADSDPAVRAAEWANARAGQEVTLADSARLPTVQALAQVNRATTNNVFGMLLPQATIPSISGPPAADTRSTSVWGTAAGALLMWDAVDFGRRDAGIRAATATANAAHADWQATRLQRQVAAGEAFLTLLAAEARVRAAIAGADRARTLRLLVEAQVAAELRPGADATRAVAELARSEVDVENARLDEARARGVVAALAGTTVDALRVAADLGARSTDVFDLPTTVAHPITTAWRARVEAAASRRDAASKGGLPTLSLSGAVYARGSGALADGTLRGGSAGLRPDFFNWGIGVTVAVPLLEFKAVRARTAAASAEVSLIEARSADVARDLTIKRTTASAEVTRARQVVRLLETQVEAARTNERQVLTRYRVGLTSLTEVADAQRLLAQTESDAAVAHLAVWLAWLHVADATGDLTAFVAALR